MIDFKDVVKAERAKERARVPAASDPGGNGKTPAELEKEIFENHEATLKSVAKEARAKEAKAAKEQEAIEAKAAEESELEVFTVEPPKNPNEICPFCLEEKSARGMNRHIAAIHKVPGVTIQDLDDVKKGLKSLEDLVTEKFPEGEAEISNLAPEVEKEHFPNWEDIEDPEGSEDPGKEALEDKRNLDNPGPPGDPSCYKNPGNPGSKDNPIERRKFNWIPFFSPFNRRRYKQ